MSKSTCGSSLCSAEGIIPAGYSIMTSMKNTALAGLLALTAIGAAASHAQAAPITMSGSLKIWSADTNSVSASETNSMYNNAANLQYTGTYTGVINFNLSDQSENTISGFLDTGTGSYSGTSSNTGLTTQLSGSNPEHVTLFEFDFTTGLDTNYTVTHDDGFSVYDTSNKEVISGYEGLYSSTTNTISLTAGTAYKLFYTEDNGLPADLVVSNVPEPASMALLGASLITMGVVGRRRKSTAAVA